MEPYNPNKSFIQFRLNPDAIKEELRGIIPGYRAVEYYRNNPDSSITNTLDLLAEDVVPFYAAHKYGANPGDYIKEAVLLGSPVKYKELRNKVKGNKPNGSWIDANGEFKDVSNAEYNGYYDWKEENPNEVHFYELEDANQALKYIDDSEQYMSTHSNPYDMKNNYGSPIFKEAMDLMNMESKIESITNPIDKAKAIKDYEAAKKVYNAKYGDEILYTNSTDWLKNQMEAERSYNMKLHKDFYENVNPKQPWGE